MKKNRKLISKALKSLNGKKVKLCGNVLKKGESYCAVGYLTAFAAKHEPKKVDRALNELGTFTEYGEEDPATGQSTPDVERRWTLGDIFDRKEENTDNAIEICSNVYGIEASSLSQMVTLNDAFTNKKVSRVERLRRALKLTLKGKKPDVDSVLENDE